MLDATSERQSFEGWIQTTRGWTACKQRGKPFSLRQTVKGDYCDYRVNDRWYAWQARAALAACAPAKSEGR